MGYTPAELDEMTLWEFAWCAKGYSDANTPADDKPPADQWEDNDLAELGVEGFKPSW